MKQKEITNKSDLPNLAKNPDLNRKLPILPTIAELKQGKIKLWNGKQMIEGFLVFFVRMFL